MAPGKSGRARVKADVAAGVVGIGASAGATKHALARAAGFDHYLVKPVDLATLNGLLKSGTAPA
jgi:CheY-like chemotaxis protein